MPVLGHGEIITEATLTAHSQATRRRTADKRRAASDSPTGYSRRWMCAII